MVVSKVPVFIHHHLQQPVFHESFRDDNSGELGTLYLPQKEISGDPGENRVRVYEKTFRWFISSLVIYLII